MCAQPEQDADVRVLLQPPQGEVWEQMGAPVHGHGLPPPRGGDAGRLPGHAGGPRRVRHERLPPRVLPVLGGEQEGGGQDEGRVRGHPDQGGGVSSLEDVLGVNGKQEHQEGQGYDEGGDKKRAAPPELPGGALRAEDVLVRRGDAVQQSPHHLRHAREQGHALALRQQALDLRRQSAHAGVRAQGHPLVRTSWRQHGIGRHNEQLFTNKHGLGPS